MTLTPDQHNTPEAMDAFWASVDEGYFQDRAWMYDFVAGYTYSQMYMSGFGGQYCDYGCGTGHFLRALQKRQPEAHYTGIDYSFEAIQRSFEYIENHRDGYFYPIVGDLCNLSIHEGKYWLGPYCAATCIQTLEHISDPGLALKNMLRYIRVGRPLILTVPNNDGWKGHHNHWTPETFRELLETYGEVAECMTFGRNEGDDTNILARVVKV